MTTNITVADYFAKFIAEREVPAVFELSGGMIAFLTDSIHRLGRTKIINTRHEQAAGFAAEAASRVSGIPTVAMATSGPGATNLMTAIGSSYFDSTPTLFITGQVHTLELKKDPRQRQNGFQELDIVAATKAITKYSIQITSAETFPEILSKAWEIAISGRPGPVLIDIPIDIQQQECDPKTIKRIQQKSENNTLDESLVNSLISRLKSATNPLILVGGGVRSSGTVPDFLEFVERLQIPVVHTLMGKDIMATKHPLNLGFIGSYGNRWANRALSQADFLLVIGSRLDVRQTGSDLKDFSEGKFIVRVDVDPYEIDGRVSANLNLPIELKEFFAKLKNIDLDPFDPTTFLKQVNTDRINFTSESEQEVRLSLSPDKCIKWISKICEDSDGFCVDVGQHQMWAAQSIEIHQGQRFLTSGGMGAMGFSLPAAIGAASSTNTHWATITGDGCMQLSSSELQTIAHYELPIVIFILNNGQHGMVAQFQEENMESRYVSTRIGYSVPNFSALADAYGIASLTVSELADFQAVEKRLKLNPRKPLIVEILIDNRAKALPKIDRFTKLSDL